MLDHNSLEDKILLQDKKIKSLEIQLDTLEKEITEFLDHLQVTPQQLTGFIEKQQHFTEENWTELQHHRKEIETKLQRELDNIRNPLKTKKNLESLHVQRHWLHVR